MSDRSKIEWTDATWNPVTGCTKISPACTHCYAERFAERFRGVANHPFEQGFDLKLWPERLNLPLSWKQRKMIFVNSMSDLFHDKIPDAYIGKVFESMAKARYHIFQVLTKRSERMLTWVRSNFAAEPNGTGKPLWPANIWLGVSVENQDYSWRIKHLQSIPFPLRYLSIEPLLGPLSLNSSLLEGISWVIVGGESGPRARPMKGEWVSDIRLQCEKYNIPFFFKQWGVYDQSGRRVGKKKAGRSFEGRTWNEIPRLPSASISERNGNYHSSSPLELSLTPCP